jgi:hypothetical protein
MGIAQHHFRSGSNDLSNERVAGSSVFVHWTAVATRMYLTTGRGGRSGS